MRKVGAHIRQELILMCSDKVNSILASQSESDMKTFRWKNLMSELSENAPVFLSLLQSCTWTRNSYINRDAIIGICTAMLLKYRYSKMSLLQRILSIILYAGHSGKEVCNIVYLCSTYAFIIFRYTKDW